MDLYRFAERLLFDFGFPCFVTFCMMVGAWKILRWLADHVIVPVVRSHIDYVKKSTIALTRCAKIQSKVLIALGNLAAKVKERPDEKDSRYRRPPHVWDAYGRRQSSPSDANDQPSGDGPGEAGPTDPSPGDNGPAER